MRALLKIPWWASLAAADAAVLARLLVASSRQQALASIAVHAGIALVAGATAIVVAPPSAVRAPRAVAAFAVLVAFFVPAFGVVAVALALGVGPRREQREAPWLTLAIERDLADVAGRPLARRPTSASTIATALRDRAPESAERRFQSLLRARHLPARAAIGLMKLALKDPSDEVRLYAFARIERMRDDLEREIKRVQTLLADATGDDAARAHLRLAESHWEIAYLGLAEGAVLDHALKNALVHVERASALRPSDAPPHFLRGRVLLQLRQIDGAASAFDAAMAHGYPRVRILPYLAECAFHERRFDRVRAALRELEDARPGYAALQPLLDTWR